MPMSDNKYKAQRELLSGGSSYKYYLQKGDKPIRFKEFLTLLAKDKTFRSFFIDLLTKVPFDAYHWETPSLMASTAEQPFEFVVTNAPGIKLPADVGPFAAYFKKDDQVAVFDNLGGDATLIAPAPAGRQFNYSHIGKFTKEAPNVQQHILWQTVGQVTVEEISDQPLWLNTAGGGVAWLHVRLDSSPKYYRHQPYVSHH